MLSTATHPNPRPQTLNLTLRAGQVCNHPALSYPHLFGLDTEHLVAACGKLLALDRMLVKLHASGHRVLLFSTMTRLLDLLQVGLA